MLESMVITSGTSRNKRLTGRVFFGTRGVFFGTGAVFFGFFRGVVGGVNCRFFWELVYAVFLFWGVVGGSSDAGAGGGGDKYASFDS